MHWLALWPIAADWSLLHLAHRHKAPEPPILTMAFQLGWLEEGAARRIKHADAPHAIFIPCCAQQELSPSLIKAAANATCSVLSWSTYPQYGHAKGKGDGGAPITSFAGANSFSSIFQTSPQPVQSCFFAKPDAESAAAVHCAVAECSQSLLVMWAEGLTHGNARRR